MEAARGAIPMRNIPLSDARSTMISGVKYWRTYSWQIISILQACDTVMATYNGNLSIISITIWEHAINDQYR